MFQPRLWPVFFALVLTAITSFNVQASAPSGETWFTLVTPHFRVHHTKALEPYAKRMASSLERALPKLETNLRWKAPTPLDVILTDPSDSANGFAMNFPSTRMELYGIPFETDSALSFYHDWVDELGVHELTHLIANDTAAGAYPFFRSIFGSWVKPNGLQPVWIIEGLAVYQETALSSAGRGRSPWLNALLRENLYSQNPSAISLDRLNDGNAWWPGGAAPYLLGYTIQALANQKHAGLPGDLNLINAGKIPFMPDDAVSRVTGREWDAVWAELPALLENRFGAATNNNASKTKNETDEPCFVTSSGKYTGGQALSPDGWVYYSEEDFSHGYHLARVRWDAPCGSATRERLVHKEHASPTQVAVSASGKLVAHAEIDHQRFERYLSDIYLWHPDTGRHEQITDGARARDPAFVGETLFFVKQNVDTTQTIARWEDGRETALFTSQPLERIGGLAGSPAAPNASANGNANSKDELYFSLHRNQGRETIHVLSARGGEARELIPAMAEREFQRNPAPQPDGSLLYGSHVGTGPLEIRRWRADTRQSEPVARTPSSFADRPIRLPNGELLAQVYGAQGLDLARLPERARGEAPKPVDLHAALSGEAPAPATPAETTAFGPSVPYSATKTAATSLWPQYWLPELFFIDDRFVAGASTGGNDPLDYHQYGLSAHYDSRAPFPLYRAFYRNRANPVNFVFELSQTNNYFRSTQVSNRINTYSGEAIVPLGLTFYGFGAAFQEKHLFNRKSQSLILLQNFTYRDVTQTPGALAPNHGLYLNAYAGLYPNAKSEALFFDIRPRAEAYFRGFAPSHSVSIGAKAGIATNRLLASNYYLGGGLGALTTTDFVVRGYPVDSLFGQRILTVNAAYTLPLAYPYRGLGTNPAFLKAWGLRFNADAGSANFLARYDRKTFRFYQAQGLGERTLLGFGADIVTSGTAFYHVPLELSAGLHYGIQRQFGGGPVFYLGFNAGLFGSSHRH